MLALSEQKSKKERKIQEITSSSNILDLEDKLKKLQGDMNTYSQSIFFSHHFTFKLRLVCFFFGFLYIASPQRGDLRLSGPPSGQGAGSGARTRDRMVPADLRADSQATVLPTPRSN
ncbi:hypothetical protein PoB_006554800 [Plakobranchus ocellatus]|uniref:Uncharacterized protein n=1 Tax=Plakobranchus ocellatus TaxID=259542 RepID=A0AAV4D4B6_9GAST|nr:hypothetical protein PoB_006554800 [Plakobranchus ocellatus]